MGAVRALGAGLVAAAVTLAARRALEASPPGGAERWTRTNHGGDPVSMLEGPAVTAGLVAGAAVAGGESRARAATVLASAGAGAFGVLDDLAEDTAHSAKGLRGHLGALARGRVTTGGLKVLGIGATSLLAAAVGTRRQGGAGRHVTDVAINAPLIAGTANLVNLLDLRPGRALKASALLAIPMVGGADGQTGALVGASAAAAPADIGARDMLGDGGANALGAFVGTCWALRAPRPVRAAALAGVVGLTLVSERVSFSAVIERTPWLHRLDQAGRRSADVVEPGREAASDEGPTA